MATKSKNDDSKIFALIGALLGIIGFIIVLIAKRDDAYAMYYAKQSLVLFIAAVIGQIVASVLVIVLIGIILLPLVGLATLILWLINIINSLSGEKTPLPFIGKYADQINL